jgi:thiamine-phosphate diphosphorylase
LRPPALGPIYAVTARGLSGLPPEEAAGIFFGAGIRAVQIREPGLPDGDLLSGILSARERAGPGMRVFAAGRCDIARIAGCGVHLQADSLPPPTARRLLGDEAAIGLSVGGLEEARKAFETPEVDYVAFGPVFRRPGGLEALAAIARLKTKPLVAAGGVGHEELERVWDAGADTAWMASALNSRPPAERARSAMDIARRRGFPKLLWLVGFMGCGKTTVGEIVARRLARPFFDLDAELERATGTTVRAIFEAAGEVDFRRRENEFVASAKQIGCGVIAAGGGTFVAEDNRRAILREGTAVFLDVPFEVLSGRLAGKTDRPLFTDPMQALRLFEDRAAFYKMAPVRVPLRGHESPEETAERVLQALDSRACVI